MKDLRAYEGNPHVDKVLRSNLQFTRDFKVKAVKAFESGKPASEIFAEAGIDLNDFGHGYGLKCIKRWQESIKKYGKKNLNKERRGVEASGRPGSLKFKSIEEEIEYLRAENDFLKSSAPWRKALSARKIQSNLQGKTILPKIVYFKALSICRGSTEWILPLD